MWLSYTYSFHQLLLGVIGFYFYLAHQYIEWGRFTLRLGALPGAFNRSSNQLMNVIILANIIFGDVPFLYAIMFSKYNQLYLGIIAFGISFVLRPADVFCAKAKRQQHVFVCAKAKRQQQHEDRHDVSLFGNATGRGVLRLNFLYFSECLDICWKEVKALTLSAQMICDDE